MSSINAYLIGDLILAAIFGVLFFLRSDLRRVMLYGGFLYLVLFTPFFFILKLINSDTAKSVTPGYWTPPTLFDIGHKTGGLAIEDILFMFFASALVVGLFDFVFNIKVGRTKNTKLKGKHALIGGMIAGLAVYALTPINAMYFLIILQFVGALILVCQRRDLLFHSFAGGIFFLMFYFVLYSLFNLIFPTFVPDYYQLQHTSHIIILKIPLEEYLYGLSFGLLWAPIYEYEYRVKDYKSRRRSLRTRKAVLAAASTRR